MFSLNGRVAVITGGAGLLGVKHAEAIAEFGGIPVLADIDGKRAEQKSGEIAKAYGTDSLGIRVDITNENDVKNLLQTVSKRFEKVDILINNAAHNPKMEAAGETNWSRLEQFPVNIWNSDIRVGLTGAFLCSKVIGAEMAKQGKGVILNISSDLGVIAPDQRIYQISGFPEEEQPVKPVTYSVIKHGLIGLTRYLSTYWATDGVRANALLPGGIYQGQDEDFVQKLTNLIPLGRMAHEDEYKAAVVFLVSDASSYMTGANIIIDGGRTVW
ncbi:MAG: SDR family oxidoreductase [Bacteroidetes bacterium]|nr:SDR family oxidoreductase [Bacteroidota bacterium]